VERLRRLSQDFLDLSRDPALVTGPADLAEIAAEAARALGHAYPDVAVRLELGTLPVNADRGRMQQVLANLLLNSAQAGAHTVELRGDRDGGSSRPGRLARPWLGRPR
jgi:signal transduction histidine kinase